MDVIKRFLQSKNFWVSTFREFFFAFVAIALVAGALYAYAGTWPPLVSVDGTSMYPHMQNGDLILIQKVSADQVRTWSDARQTGYKAFEGYGDVLVYRPFGRADLTPVIHRAMEHANQSGSMWAGSVPAPNDGYVTQGDNNYLYDQCSGICPNTPVKEEWILGVARFRIPYLGYIRNVFSFIR